MAGTNYNRGNVRRRHPERFADYDPPEKRCELLAHYIIEHETTVRAASQYFGISKSTVHKDVTVRLSEENPALYDAVKKILARNKAERHLRGGEATRQKYLHRQKIRG